MPIADSLSPARRRQIGLSLPRTLAAIHAVDVHGVGLDDLASHKPYAPRQLRRWAAQWELSKTRELPELDDLTRRLAAAAPRQRGRRTERAHRRTPATVGRTEGTAE
jgi:aminoglycoside phosphotransferase (APT) family kinase protein